nr:hypothetical protein GCM10025730_28250 [Promicromonospora thailandica]
MTATAYPLRYRSAEARGTRIGRPLRLLGRVRGVDEALLERIGRAFHEQDEPAAALAAALRLPRGARAASPMPSSGQPSPRSAPCGEIGPGLCRPRHNQPTSAIGPRP